MNGEKWRKSPVESAPFRQRARAFLWGMSERSTRLFVEQEVDELDGAELAGALEVGLAQRPVGAEGARRVRLAPVAEQPCQLRVRHPPVAVDIQAAEHLNAGDCLVGRCCFDFLIFCDVAFS